MSAFNKPILCVDFDGVIHSYKSKWTNAETISDGPVPGALNWLCDALEVFEVHIYSSRSKSPAGITAMKKWLITEATREWPEGPRADNLAGRLVFSCEKPPAFLTIDDRAMCFNGDWSQYDPAKLAKFIPWHKRLPTPESELQFEIGEDKDGNIHLNFGRDLSYMIMAPESVLQLAQVLLDKVSKVRQ